MSLSTRTRFNPGFSNRSPFSHFKNISAWGVENILPAVDTQSVTNQGDYVDEYFRAPIPSLEGYGLMGIEVNPHSPTILSFMGDEQVLTEFPRAANFNMCTFAFFGVSVFDIDYTYGAACDVTSFALDPISDDENFRFSVDVVLKSGRLKLKCYDYYFYSRPRFERPL